MPLPIPKSGESRNAFVSRFMSNTEAKRKFPEQEQRVAVAFSQFRSKKSDHGNPERKRPKMKKMTASEAQVVKVDSNLGLVFGFAIVSTVDGEPYFDVQGDHIPEDDMLKAANDFMQTSRMAKEMHRGETGSIVFAFPLTSDIAKALGIETAKTGLMIAMKPEPEVFAKFADGTYTGFSIGGDYGDTEVVP